MKNILNSQLNKHLIEPDLTTKVNHLEAEFQNMYNYISRPNLSFNDTLQTKSAFSDYIRSGQVDEFVQKALSGAENEGGALLTPSFTKRLSLGLAPPRSPMRQLASTEVISTSTLDVVY